MSGHTPGPWISLGQGDIVTKSVPTCDAEGYTDIAAVYVIANDSGAANARLIAAAPELLEALEAVLRWIDDYCETTGFEAVEAQADAAIAKATGETK